MNLRIERKLSEGVCESEIADQTRVRRTEVLFYTGNGWFVRTNQALCVSQTKQRRAPFFGLVFAILLLG